MNDLFESVRRAFDNMSEREQRLVTLTGAVLGLLLTAIPLFLMSTSNTELDDSNDEMRVLIARLSLERGKLQGLAKEHEAAMARYDNPTPPLGSFIEAEAKRQDLTIREVTEEPQKTVGRYQRRNVRVTLPNVGLSDVIHLLNNIVTSPHPVAIEQLNFEHHKTGDVYNVKIGVMTYDKKRPSSNGDGDDDSNKAEG